jgi:arsenate reductase
VLIVVSSRFNVSARFCPVFFGKATRLHHCFNDPAAVEGSEETRLGEFRRVRDELRAYLRGFPPKS